MSLFNRAHSRSGNGDQLLRSDRSKKGFFTNTFSPAKTRVPILLLGILVLASFLIAFLAKIPHVNAAATYYAIANGNWNINTTWSLTSGGSPVGVGSWPIAGDTVIIGEAGTPRAVTIPSGYSAACTSVAIGNSGNNIAASLSLANATSSLAVSGSADVNKPRGNKTNALNVNAGTVSIGGNLTLAGTSTNTKRIASAVITTGALTVSGNLVFISGVAANNLLTMSGGAGTLNLGGAFTVSNGTLAAGTTSTFNYNGTSAQAIPIGVSSIVYNNLNINNTNINGASLGAAITSTNVTGNIRTQSGTFDNGGFAIAMATSKTFEVANSATFKMTGTTGIPTGTTITKTFGATSTVNYAGAAQNVSAETYGNLTFNGSSNKTTATGTITVAGSWDVTGPTALLSANNTNITVTGNITGTGAITSGSGTISLQGNWLNGGTFTKDSGTVTYNGGSAQAVGALTYNNLIISKSGGSASLSAAGTRVDGVLTFTSGNLITSTYNLYVSSTGSVVHTSGHLVGNLRKYITTGATNKTFEIGDGLSYTPVSISFGNVSIAGDLTLTTTAGDHPNIGTSIISPSKSANRYWTTTNSGITFNTYDAVFTFINPGDLDGGANTANFVVGKYSSATWTYPAVGTKNSTNTQATGLTTFSDFQLGEASDTAPNAPVLVSPSSGTLTNDNTPTLSANYSDPDALDVGTTNYRVATSVPNCLAGTVVASGTSAVTATNNEATSWTPGSSLGVDATYYWCAQNDDGLAQSAWTSMGNFILDIAAPTFTMQYYSDSGLVTPITDNAKLKAGTYYVKISANEALSGTLTVSIAAEGTANDVTNGVTTLISGNDYKYTRVVASDAAAIGAVLEDWSVSGTDLATNSATNVNPTNEAAKAIYTDTVAPTAPGNLTLGGKTIDSITLNFGAGSSEINFSNYKVFYKQAATGVTESDTEQTDSDLGFINYNGTTNTVVASLLSDTQYVFNIWAYDTVGNKSNATEIAITTVAINHAPNVPVLVSPGSGSLTNDNTPTLSANYSDPDALDTGTTNYRIATSAPNCLAGTTVTSGTSAVTSSNNESTTWTPGSTIGSDATYFWCAQNDDSLLQSAWTSMGNFILDTSGPTLTVNQAVGQADPTNNSVINFTVVFSEPILPATFTSADITNTGSATGVTWSAPSTSDNITWAIATSAVGSQGSVIPSIDATKMTDLAGNDNAASTSTDSSVVYDSLDPTFMMQYYSDSALTTTIADNAKLKAGTYYVKISANEVLVGSPTVSILAEGITNDVTHGATVLVSGNIYKYTRVIAFDAAAIGLVMENWSVLGTDLAGNTAMDVNPTNELTKDIYTDTVDPTTPGDLTLSSKTSNSITLNFGATSTEANFDRYKVFYKQAATGASESDSQHLDSNLGYINYNSAANTVVSSLSASTQYVFNIWSYDTVGNKSNATEIAVTTNSENNLPAAPTLVSPASGSLTLDTTPTLSANYTDSDIADIGTTDYRIATSAPNCLAGTVIASGTSAATTSNSEDTTWTPSTSIGSDATYYWCARNDDGVAQSAWTSMGSVILDTTAPTLTITAPTKSSNTTITNTTIQAVDSNGLLAAKVTIDSSTTAGVTNYNCVQTNVNTVDCSIDIVSSGSLAIKAIDNVRNQIIVTESGYLISSVAPIIVVTAPTKLSNVNISNSTINVTDADGVTAASVIIDSSNTVSYTNFICTQTDANTVDCTVTITSSGNLVIKATDSLVNSATQPEDSYVIDTTLPAITITAPTKSSETTITNTTIKVTDNNAVLLANVTVDVSSTAGRANFVCAQTDVRAVNCTINISSSGNLTVKAVDNAGNITTVTESGYLIIAAALPVVTPAPTVIPAIPVVVTPTTVVPTTPAEVATVPTVIPPAVADVVANPTPVTPAATPALFDVVANLANTAQENPVPFTLGSVVVVTSAALVSIVTVRGIRRRRLEKKLKEVLKKK